MKPEEITTLAKKYANETVSVRHTTAIVADEAEDVIYWLLRTHCIVEKSKVEETEEVTIDGWVARDSNGTLWICSEEPQRYSDWWIIDTDEEYTKKELPSYLFPDLTWGSEPLEVTITIKPKKR